MVKVYIVECHIPYEGFSIEGVYSSIDAAIQFVEGQVVEKNKGYAEREYASRMSRDGKSLSWSTSWGDGYEITEHEIKGE